MSQSKAEAVALYRKALNINEGVTPDQKLVETFETVRSFVFWHPLELTTRLPAPSHGSQ
jgi:hypothetical protein